MPETLPPSDDKQSKTEELLNKLKGKEKIDPKEYAKKILSKMPAVERRLREVLDREEMDSLEIKLSHNKYMQSTNPPRYGGRLTLMFRQSDTGKLRMRRKGLSWYELDGGGFTRGIFDQDLNPENIMRGSIDGFPVELVKEKILNIADGLEDLWGELERKRK
tara:strand:- start:2171 stop:2656 length:486 start_codon:yes stop_codon:yes gene_type:complete